MPAYPDNPYLVQIDRVLPRLLALYDRNKVNPTLGMGDRYYWSWKLIDFGNGTFQGAAHGFARLLHAGLLPDYLPEASALERIDEMFIAAGTLTRPDGSLEEAFPYEGSFCVTALVAFDLLSAMSLLESRADEGWRTRNRAIVEPMIRYLCVADETHATISNHLATAAAALLMWSRQSGQAAVELSSRAEIRGLEILKRILDAQSSEGWFREYEGADPGYQSLCTYYLAEIEESRPDLMLIEPLRNSLRFLWYFAHPDGSFGGVYGSRNTRFFVPAGVEVLAAKIPEAATLAQFMRFSIAHRNVVTLETMDEPNLIPMFNAYCRAAAQTAHNPAAPSHSPEMPSLSRETWQKTYPEAGLFIDARPTRYSVVSTAKGGICYSFPHDGGQSTTDCGVVVRLADGRVATTQSQTLNNDVRVENDAITVVSHFHRMAFERPTPTKFIVLRLLNVSFMRIRPVREWIKRLLVRLLITGKHPTALRNIRRIEFAPAFRIADTFDGPDDGARSVSMPREHSAIHMASFGYWQTQDDER